MADQYIRRIRQRIEAQQNEHAHKSMHVSPGDLCRFGELTGQYHGLQQALDIIDDVLRAGQEEEDQQ